MPGKRRHSLKIEKYAESSVYIRQKICEDRYSTDAVIGELNLKQPEFKGVICAKTLYNYIAKGVFEEITTFSLWEKRKRRKRRYEQVSRISLKNKGSRSIEERPQQINNRLEYGRWEGDCIVGRRGGKKTGYLR